jgi:hypothetical protein
MLSFSRLRQHLLVLISTLLALGIDAVRFFQLCLRLRTPLVAENLFLHSQLTLYQKRHSITPLPHGRDAHCPGVAVSLVRLAVSPHCDTARDLNRLGRKSHGC